MLFGSQTGPATGPSTFLDMVSCLQGCVTRISGISGLAPKLKAQGELPFWGYGVAQDRMGSYGLHLASISSGDRHDSGGGIHQLPWHDLGADRNRSRGGGVKNRMLHIPGILDCTYHLHVSVSVCSRF